MSLPKIDHLLRGIYQQQADMLKRFEERYQGRPVYEEPVSFKDPAGKVKMSQALHVMKANESMAGDVDSPYMGGAVVKMDKKDYMDEHKRLIDMLSQVSSKTGREAAKQKKEVAGKGKRCINNIKGGCGTCGGTNGEIVLERGVSKRK